MAPGGWKGHNFSQPPPWKAGACTPTETSFPSEDLRCSQAPHFSPQKEFPEILRGSNKSLALQLLHTILVRTFWIPKPTWDQGPLLAACPPGCGLGSSNPEGH